MEHELMILPAKEEDADTLAQVIDTVYRGLEHPEWFMPDDADYIRRLMDPACGRVWKAVEKHSQRAAAVFMLLFPGNTPENLGKDAGLTEAERMGVVHVESVAVLPQYRGCGLQFRFMQLGEETARREGFTYLMCTVHPENRVSRNNMLRMGFTSVVKKEKYGGFLREVMMKRLE